MSPTYGNLELLITLSLWQHKQNQTIVISLVSYSLAATALSRYFNSFRQAHVLCTRWIAFLF